jgi:hypothetical protein
MSLRDLKNFFNKIENKLNTKIKRVRGDRNRENES